MNIIKFANEVLKPTGKKDFYFTNLLMQEMDSMYPICSIHLNENNTFTVIWGWSLDRRESTSKSVIDEQEQHNGWNSVYITKDSLFRYFLDEAFK